MTSPLPKRPHFHRPPILEQAITIVFERVRDFDSVDFGLLWTELRGQFPRADTAPRLSYALESFDGRPASIDLALVQPNLLPRSMFRNEKTGELLQVQDNSVTFNWIKTSEEDEYPRFEQTSSRFWELYRVFAKYVQDRYAQALKLRQCELVNVNMVPVDDFSDITRAFNVNAFEWDIPGLVAETYTRQRQHVIMDDAGSPVGRLHSVIAPVYDQENKKLFQFGLTARSAPTIRNEDEAVAFFNRAHNMINGAFVNSVTAEMRALWGEYDGQ